MDFQPNVFWHVPSIFEELLFLELNNDQSLEVFLKRKTPQFGQFRIDLCIDLSLPETQHFARSLRLLDIGQRAQVNLIGACKGLFNNQKLYPIAYHEHMQLERGNIHLVLTLIRNHFPQFDALDKGTQSALLKSFGSQLLGMRRRQMTEQAFPNDLDSKRFVILHPGCVLDKCNLEHFFQGLDSVADRAKLLTAIIDKFLSIRIVSELSPDSLEMAAISGIHLWNTVAKFVPLCGQLAAKRDALFSELQSLMVQQCRGDPCAIAIRMGRLLGMLNEVTTSAHQQEERFTLSKIFFPSAPDSWEDLLV